MGTTEIVAIVIVAVAALLIVGYMLTATTRKFEQRRQEAEDLRDESDIHQAAAVRAQADADRLGQIAEERRRAADEIDPDTETADNDAPDTAARQPRPDREVEQDRVRDAAPERETHRL